MTSREEWAARRDARRDALWDALVINRDGLTVEQIMEKLDCSHRQANETIRELRLFLGDFDEVNVPCTSRGERERWVYELKVGLGDETREWAANRIDDGETRLRTIRAVIASAVKATDGRKPDGRRARRIERGLRHMIEDLDAMIAESGL